MPLISIIIPVYNVERYLHKCINSVLCQTYKNIELILVDDGSTDHSGKICDEYSNGYTNVSVVHQKNAGVSSARNKGLDIAKGDYVFFLDSDDFLELNAIEKLILNGEADFIISKGYQITQNAKITIDNNIIKSEIIKMSSYKEKIFTGMLNGRIMPGPFAKMYRRSVLEKNHLRFNESIDFGEDAIFNFLFCNCATSFSNVNEYTYNYVDNANSITRKYSPKLFCRINNLVKLFKDELWSFLSFNHEEEYNSYIIYLLNYLCIGYIYNKQIGMSSKEQRVLLKEITNREEYRYAIKNVKLGRLSLRRKLLIILLRLKLYGIIRYVYTF